MTLARVALAVALLTGVARADSEQDAKAKAVAEEGAALFDRNDFVGAAAKFEEAYAVNGDPTYLFNAAQAYRHGGDCVRAADDYRRMLAEVEHPPNEDKIRNWYESEAECAKQRTAAQPPPVTPPHAPVVTTHTEAPAVPENPRSWHHPAAYTAFAVAGLALAGASYFAWDAHDAADRRDDLLSGCNDASPCSTSAVKDYDDRGDRAATLARVGLAITGVGVATGIVFLVLGRQGDSEQVTVAPARGGAVASAAFRF